MRIAYRNMGRQLWELEAWVLKGERCSSHEKIIRRLQMSLL